MKLNIVFSVLFLTQLAWSNPSVLCETNADEKFVQFSQSVIPRQEKTIEVLTWNVYKFKKENSFSDLVSLANKSDIALVQEAVHSQELQTNAAQNVSMDWTFFKSFCRDYGATGVQTGSRFPQVEVEAILAPGLEPVVNTPKVTGFSTVEIHGAKVLLINVHGMNANKGLDFEKHMDQIYEVAKDFQGPIIWAGDFNTWNPVRTAYLNAKAKALNMTVLKPEVDNRKLKLDHIIVRGFKAKSVTILENVVSSDHLPVRAELELSQ
ncbi:MAG: endonuclease/exonuclease/phosphatase family protein [Pseudobdellovibrio sp.]|nr:endonuclease/exonuclease/phosphatase family protein [Pseudobdellovibrio sp.]